MSQHHSLLQTIPFAGLILGFAVVSIFFSIVSPDELITWIGVENAFLFLFALSFFSGVLAFSGIPYHWVLVAFALNGLNPWLLGGVAALGVTLGDTTSYFVGYYGRSVVPHDWHGIIERLNAYMSKYPRLMPVFFFIYGSVAPFSNDLIGITMGVARYPILRVMVPLGLGNIVFNTTLAFLAVYAYGVVETLSGWLF